jgi:hypothetical protein
MFKYMVCKSRYFFGTEDYLEAHILVLIATIFMLKL